MRCSLLLTFCFLQEREINCRCTQIKRETNFSLLETRTMYSRDDVENCNLKVLKNKVSRHEINSERRLFDEKVAIEFEWI